MRDHGIGAIVIVNDFEVIAGWKPETHREAGKRINARRITRMTGVNGMTVHNDPCPTGAATSVG
jgi:hypothetical protein